MEKLDFGAKIGNISEMSKIKT